MGNFQWTDELVQELLNITVFHATEHWKENIKEFKKSKEKKPLFTTEDGKEVLHTEAIWVVMPDFNILLVSACDCTPHKDHKYFSTRKAAEHYIIENKPCLSLKEISKVCPFVTWYDNQTLIRTIKNKLNL